MMDRLGPGAYLGPDSQRITIVGSKLSVLSFLCVLDAVSIAIMTPRSLSSAEVSRIPRNSFKFSVVCEGNSRGKPLPKNGRNSARLVEIMLKLA